MKPFKKKGHFVFDFDDTLANSYAFNEQSVVEMLAPYVDVHDIKNEKYIRNQFKAWKGSPLYDQYARLIEYFELVLNPQDILDASEEYHQEKLPNVEMFEMVHDFLKALKKQGKQVSVCSNREKGSLMKVMEKHKLVNVFDNIISCKERGYEKPDPFCLLELIDQTGTDKDEVVFLGDSETDAEFARAAGVDYMIVDHYQNQGSFYRVLMQAFM